MFKPQSVTTKKSKGWKIFLGISSATILATGVGVGLSSCGSKPTETKFSVSCENPNLIFNTPDTLSLTWKAANFTPTSITLKDGDGDPNWTLTGGTNSTLTLERKKQNLWLGTYDVTLVASNNTTEKEATIAVKVFVPLPIDKYLAIKTDDSIINGNITTTLDLNSHLNQLSLKYLYIPANSTLETLKCAQNQLTSLDVSGCEKLEWLDCYENQLTSLDVSRCYMLEYLDCSTNQLASIDVLKCTNLTSLYCKSNNITSLDLSNNILLCKQPPYDELWCCANHNLNSIKLPNTTNNLSFSWAWLTDDCANDGTVQKAANTTIGGTKPTNWTEVPY